MEPINKLKSLVVEGALLLGATACLPQSLLQILPTGTVNGTIPATQTIIPANHCLGIELGKLQILRIPGR